MGGPRIAPYRGIGLDQDDLADFVEPAECAARMGITVAEVIRLVRRGALRHSGGLIQPALLV